MSNVLILNTTDVDQTVILIPTNEAIKISPGASCIIDEYNKDHSYLYKSYSRKGLTVKIVDDKIFDTVNSDEVIDSTTNENPLPDITSENTILTEESVKEDKPKKKSRKSNKEVSESSEEVSATTESGE